MSVALCLWFYVGLPNPGLGGAVFWSLLCELVYYGLYPALRRLARSVGWPALVLVTLVPSALIAFTIRVSGDYTDAGPRLIWLLGLPVWLLGCVVAEAPLRRLHLTRTLMWTLRLGIWTLSICASVLRFHTQIKYPMSLSIFAFPVSFWLWCEI